MKKTTITPPDCYFVSLTQQLGPVSAETKQNAIDTTNATIQEARDKVFSVTDVKYFEPKGDN